MEQLCGICIGQNNSKSSFRNIKYHINSGLYKLDFVNNRNVSAAMLLHT